MIEVKIQGGSRLGRLPYTCADCKLEEIKESKPWTTRDHKLKFAGTWIERPQSIPLCDRCVFVEWRHLKHTPSPCCQSLMLVYMHRTLCCRALHTQRAARARFWQQDAAEEPWCLVEVGLETATPAEWTWTWIMNALSSETEKFVILTNSENAILRILKTICFCWKISERTSGCCFAPKSRALFGRSSRLRTRFFSEPAAYFSTLPKTASSHNCCCICP